LAAGETLTAFYAFAAAVFGLLVGSFVNVVVHRVPRGHRHVVEQAEAHRLRRAGVVTGRPVDAESRGRRTGEESLGELHRPSGAVQSSRVRPGAHRGVKVDPAAAPCRHGAEHVDVCRRVDRLEHLAAEVDLPFAHGPLLWLRVATRRLAPHRELCASRRVARIEHLLQQRDVDGVTRRFSLALPTEDGSFPTFAGRLWKALAAEINSTNST